MQCFFVLSGFLISHILLADKQYHPRLGKCLGVFTRPRALRIFPLYFLYLLLSAAFNLFMGVEGFRDAAGFLFSFTYNWTFALGLGVYKLTTSHLDAFACGGAVAFVALTLLIAYFTYEYIEKPFLRVKDPIKTNMQLQKA